MLEIEAEFVRQALKAGVATKIAELSAEVAQAIDTYPATGGRGYLERLHDQRRELNHPNLRMLAALVCALCVEDPDKAPALARTFNTLALRHPALARFNITMQELAAKKGATKLRPSLGPMG
jgi:hypothetical protein